MKNVFYKDNSGRLLPLLPMLNENLEFFNNATAGRIPNSDEYNALAELLEALADAIVIDSREAESARRQVLVAARSMRFHARERWAAGL